MHQGFLESLAEEQSVQVKGEAPQDQGKNIFQERTIARVVSQTIPRAFTDPETTQVPTCQGAKVSLHTLKRRDPRKVTPEQCG